MMRQSGAPTENAPATMSVANVKSFVRVIASDLQNGLVGIFVDRFSVRSERQRLA